MSVKKIICSIREHHTLEAIKVFEVEIGSQKSPQGC